MPNGNAAAASSPDVGQADSLFRAAVLGFIDDDLAEAIRKQLAEAVRVRRSREGST